MNLRPYQQHAVDEVESYLGENPILCLPTGAGKTVTAVHLVRQLNRPTLWLAHRRELIQQAADGLRGYGLPCGIIMAGHPHTDELTQVASVQTLVRRDFPAAGLVVVDEAHHVRAGSYQRIVDNYPGVPIVGLTATPFRLDGRGLGTSFGRIVVGAYVDDLVDDGYLIAPKVFAPEVPAMRKAAVRRGDYTDHDMMDAVGKRRIVGDIVKTWLRRAAGKRTIVFAVNVPHSEMIVAEFKRAGIRAEHLDGTTSRSLRDAILYRLRTGYTQVVSNCQVLTEGWDLPALECAIVARPTASLCLHLQMIGRVMRAADGKEAAIVLDHAGNHLRHGFVTQRLDYSLEDRVLVTTGGKSDEPAPGKLCPDCYRLVLGGSRCPECGHLFQADIPHHVAGELQELQPEAHPVPPAPPHDVQQAAWDEFERIRAARGYKPEWVFRRFKQVYGFYPLVVDGRLVDPGNASEDEKYRVWRQLVTLGRERKYNKPEGWAAHRFRDKFGHWPSRRVTAN